MYEVNYLAAVFLIALLVGVIKGYRKGFLRILVYLAGLVVVLLIVTKISPYVSEFLIEKTNAYDVVKQKIETVYREHQGQSAYSTETEESENSDASDTNLIVELFGLPDILSENLMNNNNEDTYSKLAVALFEEYVSGYLARLVIKAGSFCGLFVALAIVMFCVLAAIKIIEKIPVLKTFNRLLGMFAGGGMVVIFTWVFFIAAIVFFYDSVGKWTLTQIKSSSILSYLYNNNYLFRFLLK